MVGTVPEIRRPSRRITVAVLVGLVALATGCAASEPAAPAKPRVVVSTPILGDLVQQTLGDQAQVEVLVPRGVDVSSYLLTESQREHLQHSPVVVVVGFGADPDLGDLPARAQRNGNTVIEAAPRLNPIPLGAGSLTPDRPDPNVWLDSDRMTQLARLVADEVGRLPSVDRDAIGRRTQDYADRLARADEAIQAALLPVPDAQRSLVTQHDVLGYFAERYGLRVSAVLQPDPAHLPTATELDAVAAQMRKDGTRVVLADREPLLQITALTTRVEDAELVAIDLRTLGPPGSETDSLEHLLLALAALGPALTTG